MSNFINDRMAELNEKFRCLSDDTHFYTPDFIGDDFVEGMGNRHFVKKELRAFLKTSLESMIEDIENGLPEYRIANYEENNYEAGYNEALSQIQTLLQSYKKDL